jgi:4-amino-4-deoxy-L-arabinose transferase-like glycosyltransferase
MVLGQLLNLATLFYAGRIARDFIGRDAVLPIVILVGASVFLSASLLTIALNVDQLQAPLWTALVYFGMRAARDDGWLDWTLFVATLGLSLLAKYFVVVLVLALALLVAAMAVPGYRRIFASIKFYVACILALLIVLPYLVALTRHPEAIGYVKSFFSSDKTRLTAFSNFIYPVVLTLLPIGIAAIWLYPRGLIHIARGTANPHVRFLLIAVVVFAAIQGTLILFGFDYSQRHPYPFLALSAVLFLGFVRVDPRGLPRFAGLMLAIWAIVVAGTVVYALLVLRPDLRQPAPTTAAAINRQWQRNFKCGPAYIMGFKDAAFAIAFYFRDGGHDVIGVSLGDYLHHAQWIDRDRIHQQGAIVVGDDADEVTKLFANDFSRRSAPMFVSLPYRHKWSDARKTYAYTFIAPEGC